MVDWQEEFLRIQRILTRQQERTCELSALVRDCKEYFIIIEEHGHKGVGSVNCREIANKALKRIGELP